MIFCYSVIVPFGSIFLAKIFFWGYRSATTSDREAFNQFIHQCGRLIGFGDMLTLGIFALGILQFVNASFIL